MMRSSSKQNAANGSAPRAKKTAKPKRHIIDLIEIYGANMKKDRNYAFESLKSFVERHREDINYCDDTGKTALMYAREKGYHDIVNLLLKNGAFVESVDAYGKYMIMLAAKDSQDVVMLTRIDHRRAPVPITRDEEDDQTEQGGPKRDVTRAHISRKVYEKPIETSRDEILKKVALNSTLGSRVPLYCIGSLAAAQAFVIEGNSKPPEPEPEEEEEEESNAEIQAEPDAALVEDAAEAPEELKRTDDGASAQHENQLQPTPQDEAFEQSFGTDTSGKSDGSALHPKGSPSCDDLEQVYKAVCPHDLFVYDHSVGASGDTDDTTGIALDTSSLAVTDASTEPPQGKTMALSPLLIEDLSQPEGEFTPEPRVEDAFGEFLVEEDGETESETDEVKEEENRGPNVPDDVPVGSSSQAVQGSEKSSASRKLGSHLSANFNSVATLQQAIDETNAAHDLWVKEQRDLEESLSRHAASGNVIAKAREMMNKKREVEKIKEQWLTKVRRVEQLKGEQAERVPDNVKLRSKNTEESNAKIQQWLEKQKNVDDIINFYEKMSPVTAAKSRGVDGMSKSMMHSPKGPRQGSFMFRSKHELDALDAALSGGVSDAPAPPVLAHSSSSGGGDFGRSPVTSTDSQSDYADEAPKSARSDTVVVVRRGSGAWKEPADPVAAAQRELSADSSSS